MIAPTTRKADRRHHDPLSLVETPEVLNGLRR